MHANFLKYLFGKLNDRATLKPQILFLSHYQIKLVSLLILNGLNCLRTT